MAEGDARDENGCLGHENHACMLPPSPAAVRTAGGTVLSGVTGAEGPLNSAHSLPLAGSMGKRLGGCCLAFPLPLALT